MRNSNHFLFTLSISAALFGLFLIASPAHAASLEYGSIYRVDSIPGSTDKNVIILYGGLEDKQYFSCALSTFACIDEGTSTPPLPPTATTTAYESTAPQSIPTTQPFDVISGVTRLSDRNITPDGKFAYYYQYADSTHPTRTIAIVSEKTGITYSQVDQVNYWDLLTEENHLFAVSPDSKTFDYLDDRNGYPTLYQVDLTHLTKASVKGQQLTTKAYGISDFMFADNSTLLIQANRTNPYDWALYTYNTKTGALKQVIDNVSYGEPFQRIGNYISFLHIEGNSIVPMLYDTLDGTVHHFGITQAPGITQVVNPGTPIKIGTTWGVLMKPTNYDPKKSYPVIIWVHGGPYRQTSIGIHPYLSYGVYDWILEKARENGAIVLKLDYHGSYGFGRPFAEALKEHAGVIDVADVYTATNYLKSKYNVNSTYIVGNSYGGYLALKSVVAHPTTYAGAFSINGVTDWPTLLNWIGNSIFNVYFDGLPTVANSPLYSQADIIDHVNVLTNQKIMLVQAQADTDIGTNQAEYLNTVLNNKGKNVSILRIPDEDHVFHKNSSITSICSALHTFIGLNQTESCLYQ